MNENQPVICLDHVSKTFNGRKVLDDVSIEVDAAEAFCLLGRSGAGKSVSLKLMIGLIKPDQGRVFIEGKEIETMKPAELGEVRKKIGFLFQNAALLDSITVGENVAFPLRRHTKKSEDEIQSIVRERLKDVELEKDADKMPSELSGGMQKRAGLARALVMDPRIVLVDEPSSGLDTITAEEIYDLLYEMKKKHKVSLVVVTHDAIGVRKFTDRYAVLENAKIVATGTAEELQRSKNPLVRNLAEGSET